MARKVIRIQDFGGGQSQFEKLSIEEGGFLRGVQLDYRTDPAALQLNKDEVGTSLPTTIDLAKWLVPGGLITQALYSLDASGFIKRRLISGAWDMLTSHASSAGQGLGYWRGDDCLHFANYQQVGKYGPLAGTPTHQPAWQVLESDDDFHPILEFRDFQAYGNGRYVATWDATTWDNDRVILPSGWRVRCLGVWKEYLAIGCWRGNTIDAYSKGIIFFWDGVSSTYNFFEITRGAVAAMGTIGSDLYLLLGPRAELWKYNGNLSKVTDFPGVKPFGDMLSINPGATNIHKGMLMMGVAAKTSLASAGRGVYSYGTANPAIPKTLNLEYLGSGGVAASFENLAQNRIGALGSIQNKLFFSTYHSTITNMPVVVEIDGGSPFVTTRGGRFESLVIDDREPHRIKKGLKFIANFSPLPTGVTMTFLYRADGGSWTTIGTVTTDGEVEFEETRDPLPFDFREIQLGCTFNQAASDPQPKLYSMLLEFESEKTL